MIWSEILAEGATPLVLAVYFLLLAAISIRSYYERRDDDYEHYMIGGRKVGLIGTVASLSSGYRDGAGIAVWVLLSFLFGFGALWLYFGLAAGLILLALLAPAVRTLGEERGYITIGDLLGDLFGPKTATVCSIVVAISAFLYSAAQLFVAGTIFSELLDFSGNFGIILTAAIIAVYLAIGGYSTVIKTDVLQWGFIMVVIVLPFWVEGHSFELADMATVLKPSLGAAASMFGIGLAFAIANPDVWQRIFSASSPRRARASFLLTVPVYFLICNGLVMFSLALQAVLTEVDPQRAFFATFTTDFLPPLALPFVAVFAISSLMSTLDTQIFLFSSTVSRNLSRSAAGGRSSGTVGWSRLITVGLLALLSLLAMTIQDLIAFVLEAASLVTVLGPVLVYAVSSRISRRRPRDGLLAAGLLAAVAVYGVMFASGLLAEMAYFCIPAGASLVACLVAWACAGPAPARKPGLAADQNETRVERPIVRG